MSDRRKRKKRYARQSLAVLTAALLLGAAAAVFYGITLFYGEKAPESTSENNTSEELFYEELVNKYSKEYSVPQNIIYAVMRVESAFDPDAVSHAGAVGLMQLIPSTFEWLCSVTGEEYLRERLFDPEINIKYGTMFLSRLYSQYGDWQLVHAAYNAGQGNVNKWLSDERYSENGNLTSIPFAETRAYIEKVEYYKEHYKSIYEQKGW
ncbi:MAG: lytic transglycosylase domain-containing protein [Ruminococcaceae bacterium]|nr:lytic transglycosylase domain-containing protein [Oscillospiraceae bacterium]